MSRNTLVGLTLVGLLSLAVKPVNANSHAWRFNEFFSNSTGTIQFVELRESMGLANEIFLTGLQITSNASVFTFPPPFLTPPTTNKYLLLATAGFAALPGAPAPDYIIPDGYFAMNVDNLSYYLYDSFVIAPGELPIDGINSLNRDKTTGVNSPTNFLGETGSVDVSTPTGIKLGEAGFFTLRQNYPNPLNPTTTIEFSINEPARVILEIYDVAGALVTTLVDELRAPSVLHRAVWNGTNAIGEKVPSGIYFYRMTAGNSVLTKKLVLLR